MNMKMLKTQTGMSLYVTFVEKEGPFLKIWGQTDKNHSVYVEQFLMGAGPQFDMGVAKVTPEHVQLNTLICAKYKDSKYYRARVLNNAFLQKGQVEVSFLDYGNKDVVSIDNLRSLQSFPTSFISIPPLAEGFIFAEAHCVGGGEWNDQIFKSIEKEIKYREVHCQLLSPTTQSYLIKIFIDNTDLCNVLIQRGLMHPISLQAQQAVLLSMSMQRQQEASTAPTTSPPNNISSGALNTYKASSLEPNCLYPVYVSYVNDGPCHFSVQLKNSEEVLVKLMNEINSISLRLLEDIPIPGTICLARCQEDGNVCRAVVTNEVDNQFKVFYVDFGNYEVVPLDSLYQINFKYVLPKVMAIRVCLNGVEKSTVTLDMQRDFKQFVDNRLLHMKVMPSPQRMAIPKCELWDPETKTSALDVVNRAARHAYPEPISLTRGFSQLVKISFVYSCNRFYVQLSSKENELTTLMSDLQEICQWNESMDPASLKSGLPCCALYETDGQWYRSQVVDVDGDTVIVRYIDYGNEESVSSSKLKNIHGEQLTVLRPQAIECCLNGYQNMDDDPARDQLFEELILESEFTMKVVEMFNKKALVELFDANNCNVASLLLDRLAMATSQVSPALVVQAGNKIEHKKSLSQQNGPIKGRDGQVFKFDREDRGDRYDRGGRFDRGDRRDRGDRGDRDRGDRGDRDRGDRGDRRERRDFNKAPNENWRQDGNKEFRKYDKNSNDNGQDSWRQNNKGFSPKHQNKYGKATESDAWRTNTSPPKNNDKWKNNQNDRNGSSNNSSSGSGDTWNTPSAPSNNDERNNFGDGRGGRGGGDRFNNDRGGRGGGGGNRGDKFRGKSRDRDGGFKNKSDSRSENSYDGSEKSYHAKGPRTSSRNDRFQKNFDKPRGNSSYQSSSEDSWNVSAVTSPINAAPPKATYGSCQVVGTEAKKVTISWFHNPSHFYLQLCDSQEEFKLLMEDIQQFYKSRKPETVSAIGAPVVGLFPEDNVVYRAQILEILGSQYKIYYVDFGNVSTVTKIWPIEKKFMALPAQAIVCSLRDVAPPGEAGTWPDADAFGSYFDRDSFTCKFIDEDENKTYVNLFYNSEDISEVLVQNGLAVSTKSSIPPVEIPLLLGQQFRAVVKSVNNLADIILALECGLVICCAMHNLDTAAETYEDTLKAMLEQTVIVYVDNVIDDKLEITLYDTEGNKLVIVNPDEGSFDVIDPLCPTLVLRSSIAGYVSFADEFCVYIQLTEYAEIVTWMLEQLFEFYDGKDNAGGSIIPEEEQICAVHSDDGNWYRGKVLSFDDETVTVTYVDYGNTEMVKFDALRELSPLFKESCTLCLKVNIGAEATPYMDKDVTASIFCGPEGWEGTVYVSEQTTESSVPVTSEDTGIHSTSYEDAQAVPVEDVGEMQADTDAADRGNAQCQNGTMVFISHVDSPNEFYVQLTDSLSAIEDLQATLQKKVSEMPILETPSAGMLCAAPYSLDQEWYRAEILDADDDITTVRFVDFGNTDVIDNKTTQIKTLSSELLTLAVYATKCSLMVKPIEEEWSPLALELFETLTSEGLMADFLHQDGKLNYVELYFSDKKISEILIEEDLAVLVETQVEDTTKGKLTGFVSHINSPSEFWIQLENCIDDLEWIAEQLSTAENFLELEDLTPGTLCAALFPDDQMWYRARILSNTVAGIELLFIDYGNSCTGSSLRQLPEDLVMFQPLAMKCSLQKPKDLANWSETASSKFSELSAEGQTIFSLKKLSTDETSIVQLLLNDEDIVPKLLEADTSSEEVTAPVTSSAEEENEDTAAAVSTTEKSETVPSAEKDEENDESTEGDTTAHSTEEGYVTEVESLENLKIEVAGKPKADTYQLERVDGDKAYDNTAIEKFKDINQEGTTLYQIEFLENNTVRLYLEGKDITPLLLPYHKCVDYENYLETTEDVNKENDNIEEKSVTETKLVSDVSPIITQDEEEINVDVRESQEESQTLNKSSLDENFEIENHKVIQDNLESDSETNESQFDSPKPAVSEVLTAQQTGSSDIPLKNESLPCEGITEHKMAVSEGFASKFESVNSRVENPKNDENQKDDQGAEKPTAHLESDNDKLGIDNVPSVLETVERPKKYETEKSHQAVEDTPHLTSNDDKLNINDVESSNKGETENNTQDDEDSQHLVSNDVKLATNDVPSMFETVESPRKDETKKDYQKDETEKDYQNADDTAHLVANDGKLGTNDVSSNLETVGDTKKDEIQKDNQDAENNAKLGTDDDSLKLETVESPVKAESPKDNQVVDDTSQLVSNDEKMDANDIPIKLESVESPKKIKTTKGNQVAEVVSHLIQNDEILGAKDIPAKLETVENHKDDEVAKDKPHLLLNDEKLGTYNVPSNIETIESPKKDENQKDNQGRKERAHLEPNDDKFYTSDVISKLKIVDCTETDENQHHDVSSLLETQSLANQPATTPETDDIVAHLKTIVPDSVSPRLPSKSSPQCSRETSRPSSRSSRRCSHDERVLPAYLSRPESPYKDYYGADSENRDAEIETLLGKVIDKVADVEALQVRSRPHSRLSHDERIVPGVVSRPASPRQEDNV